MYSVRIRLTELVGFRIGHRNDWYSVRSSRSLRNNLFQISFRGGGGSRPIVPVRMNIKP